MAHARLLIYLYPGAAGLIRGDETPLLDAEQHRAFRDRCEDMAVCGFTVVGLKQSVAPQAAACSRGQQAVLQELLSDPNFCLAEALGLPTRRLGPVRVYERLTLLVTAGWISHALEPRRTPKRHPTYVAHLLRQKR